jgi:hypothetical protein
LGCHRSTCLAAPSLERITLDTDCEVPNRAMWIDLMPSAFAVFVLPRFGDVPRERRPAGKLRRDE